MDGYNHFLKINKSATQGYTFAMTAYGIWILPLIHEIRATHPQVRKLWYVDGAGVVGKFDALREHIWEMLVREFLWGYFLDPTKSILVAFLRKFQRTEARFRGMGMHMVKRSRYLASFISDQDSENKWLAETVTG